MMIRKCLIYGGLLLIAASLCLTGYYKWTEKRASENAKRVMGKMEEIYSQSDDREVSEELPEPESRMATMEIEGEEYIGMITIPSFQISLPVMSDWSYEKLKTAPCRYSGSAYADNMIIAAHNYPAHFGSLKDLNAGDEVTFLDADGNEFVYTVSETEELRSNAVEEMEEGDWDLTLFTCTLGGRKRVTVRCIRTG